MAELKPEELLFSAEELLPSEESLGLDDDEPDEVSELADESDNEDESEDDESDENRFCRSGLDLSIASFK